MPPQAPTKARRLPRAGASREGSIMGKRLVGGWLVVRCGSCSAICRQLRSTLGSKAIWETVDKATRTRPWVSPRNWSSTARKSRKELSFIGRQELHQVQDNLYQNPTIVEYLNRFAVGEYSSPMPMQHRQRHFPIFRSDREVSTIPLDRKSGSVVFRGRRPDSYNRLTKAR